MTDRTVTPRRRNVLLIVADQLRPDALGCYGAPHARTPHLDALATRGARFERHYSVTAPCGPARESLLTGVYQSVHRVVSNRTRADDTRPNLATALALAGIASHVVGYTDTVADGASGDGETVPRGFTWHTRFNLNRAGLRSWLDHLAAHGQPVPDDPMDVLLPAPGSRNLARYPAELSDTAFVADRTIDCMAGLGNRPWLILATFLRPHPPWVAPFPYDRLHDPADMAAPLRAASRAEEGGRHPFLRHWVGRDVPDTAPADLTAQAVAAHRATYFGLVSEVDHHVGRILTALEDLGRAQDTLVVVTADHGDTLGDHWSLGTGGFRETAYRVPLIVAAPERRAAATVTAPTESVDVAPTVLDWAGAPALPWSSGHSLLPFLSDSAGHTPWPRSEIVHEFDFRDPVHRVPERAMGLSPQECNLAVLRGPRFTYVHFPGQQPLLFDQLDDPGEGRNLAGLPQYEQVLVDCARRLLDHRMRHADQARADLVATTSGNGTAPRPPRRAT
ncbi:MULTISPECIES: sulfatase-like hydrolase/transferase [unclassified Streptomyces]|uniref:sulfatase-like hydrolase/transferase n=1 Tax=unclassified Streptomyces TaxID=2593676 RepID=UPI001314B0F4|nr:MULTISPECIES: sulfatase-like hydrolase/transferase [unclassified Streptomyces]